MQKSFTKILHKRQKVLQKGNQGQVRWLNFRRARGGLPIVLAIRARAVSEIPWVLELDQDGDSALGRPHYTGHLGAVLGRDRGDSRQRWDPVHTRAFPLCRDSRPAQAETEAHALAGDPRPTGILGVPTHLPGSPNSAQAPIE